jgi:hypothetical protein
VVFDQIEHFLRPRQTWSSTKSNISFDHVKRGLRPKSNMIFN